ncbi:hypothetical protein SpiGrapes_1880 [Sphaerochaeta pleomorpha str. Grapes]|uniref:Lipoprotein n=1 Tax=Sphaerochaeta pleomorpha (strain ATCC BAA-1885 / DSM 22778 / Grapes) TaxID=158190 RepID=G8QYP7_SPHPG|nr:hypothetical protein [Sphaerochaeta pleomorpha]AEV29674.1 hypothetical protein SpiGrapes_1880 [Sphaerochaeta pleomorpha str. Grapes]
MKKILLLFIFFVTCSCSLDPISLFSIQVTLAGKHPWEDAATKSLWYTLCWSDGSGGVQKRYIGKDVHSVSIQVPRGKTTFICAYPLGFLFPYGGACIPTDRKPIMLNQDEGALCDQLLSLSQSEYDAVSTLNYPMVLQVFRNRKEDFSLFDYHLFAKDLSNGELSASSLDFLEPVSVCIEDIPPGYWVGERESDGAFWSQLGDGGVGLLLSDGLHCFLNKEDDLMLKVFVDIYTKTSFSSLREAPSW